MKQKIFYSAIAFFLLLAGLVIYRMAGMLLEPANLFRTGSAIWVILLFVWSVFTAVSAIHRKAILLPLQGRKDELLTLSYAAVLIMAGFLLAGQGRLLAGKAMVSLFPFQTIDTMLGQAFIAASLVIACLFIIHGLLCFAVPGRNPFLFPLSAMLAAIGLMLLFRLGPDIAVLRQKPGFALLFWSQFRSLLVSLFVFTGALYFFTPSRLNRLTQIRYIYVLASIILISITALVGTEMHGRRLSVNLGIMNFQTVELVKLLALFFMVGYFRYEGRFLEQGRNRFGLPRGRYLLPYLFMWMLVLLPIFLQRDLGPTMLIFSLFLVIFYLGTGSAMSVFSGFVLMGMAGTITYLTRFPSMVRTRVDMWLDPFHFSQNISESLWAAASGGLFGKGAGMGLAHRIPVVQSDFNFSVIAEEWGLVGVMAVLVIFAGLVGICLQVARRQEKPYMQLLAAGLGSLWMLQTLVIISGNMALLPLTGITLPFISFGGSSLLMNFVMLAIVLRLSEVQYEEQSSLKDKPTVVPE